VVAKEMALVAVIQRGCEKELDHSQASHLLKAPVCGIHASANDSKLASGNLLAQKVVFRKVNLFVKAGKLIEAPLVEKHEHSGAEGLMQTGKVLKQVVAEVDGFINPVALTADNVGGNAMEIFTLGQFHGPPDERVRAGLDIGIDEEYELGVGQGSSGIAAD